MKKILISTLLILGLAAGYAFAYKSGYGYGMGGCGYHKMGCAMMTHHGMMSKCPVASGYAHGWDKEIYRKYLDETADLRREMNNVRFDFKEARRNPDTTQKILAELEKKFFDLHAQVQEKFRQMQQAI